VAPVDNVADIRRPLQGQARHPGTLGSTTKGELDQHGGKRYPGTSEWRGRKKAKRSEQDAMKGVTATDIGESEEGKRPRGEGAGARSMDLGDRERSAPAKLDKRQQGAWRGARSLMVASSKRFTYWNLKDVAVQSSQSTRPTGNHF